MTWKNTVRRGTTAYIIIKPTKEEAISEQIFVIWEKENCGY